MNMYTECPNTSNSNSNTNATNPNNKRKLPSGADHHLLDHHGFSSPSSFLMSMQDIINSGDGVCDLEQTMSLRPPTEFLSTDTFQFFNDLIIGSNKKPRLEHSSSFDDSLDLLADFYSTDNNVSSASVTPLLDFIQQPADASLHGHGYGDCLPQNTGSKESIHGNLLSDPTVNQFSSLNLHHRQSMQNSYHQHHHNQMDQHLHHYQPVGQISNLSVDVSLPSSDLIDVDRFYMDPSFCQMPGLCAEDDVADCAPQPKSTIPNDHTPTNPGSYSSCPVPPPALIQPRVFSDPSIDPQFSEFGTVRIPVFLHNVDATLRDIFKPSNRLSLELIAYHCDGNSILGSYTYTQNQAPRSYKPLLDELMFSEAQGLLQAIVTPSAELEFQPAGTVDIKVFLKKQRDDDSFVLNELLKELFPQDFQLQEHLHYINEMKIWSERNDDWTTFSGLLSNLESNGYTEAPHPVGLSVPLRSYQLQSLQFMLDAENREDGLLSINYQKLPSLTASAEPLMYSSTLSHLTPYRKGVSRGGFLCEEMGLGKTIEILALILSNPCPPEKATSPGFSRGTLIVCPVSIVGQWANEVKSKLAANLSIYMYHGSKRIRDPKKLSKFDIVITTYATLGSDFSKATQATRHGSGFAEQFCPLLSVDWWRIVLDESHTVKDPAPLHSRACARLKAERRWCCTGTPINTSIYDLYGQFLFLQLEPLDNKEVFRRRIGRPYERHCKNEDQTVLLWTLNKMMIRHTKQQKMNGRELLLLPPKTEQDIIVSFSPDERLAYDAVYQKVRAKFEQFRSWGPTIVSKNILQIMSLLLPLRRLCSGGFISHFELNAMESVKRENHMPLLDSCPDPSKLLQAHEKEVDQIEVQCGMCFEIMECPTRTPCNHWFCLECVVSVLGAGPPNCPTCKCPLQIDQLETYSKHAGLPLIDSEFTVSMPPVMGYEDGQTVTGVQMDSKLRTLLADLAIVREENPSAKVLIFSQFTQTIAWLKNEFKNQGITYRFISGDMPMKKRAQAIEAFQKDPPSTIFLLSIRTGAVGLTLTAASHVYMLEPCLNPALEEQAVGRCWRMGQERPVVIKRLYVENSVEANILKLLQTRRAHVKHAAPQDASEASTRTKAGKNISTDVAGCIRSDKQNLRLSEFEILFRRRSNCPFTIHRPYIVISFLPIS